MRPRARAGFFSARWKPDRWMSNYHDDSLHYLGERPSRAFARFFVVLNMGLAGGRQLLARRRVDA